MYHKREIIRGIIMKETANQFIKPLTCKRNEKGNLEIGGCDVEELVKKYGSPLMIYDETTIRSIIKDFKEAFKGADIHLMYAAKSFMTKAMCKIMSQENVGMDCVSTGEIYTAYSSGFDMKNIVFNGNNKTPDEIDFAIEHGVELFSVDNFYEAKLVNKIAGEKNKKINILLRINPGIECHTHDYIKTGNTDSKFGFDITQTDEIVSLVLNEYKNLNLTGLHAHLGSQIFETEVYKDAVKIFMRESKKIKEKYGTDIHTFNIGGGAGIKYIEEDKPVSVYKIAETVKSAFTEYSKEVGIDNVTIYLEPGRCISGTAGVTVYTVGSMKQVPEGRKYVSVDGGMADNIRPALYGAEYTIETVADKTSSPVEKVTIAGRYCESGDIIKKDITLPKLESGDLICVYDTGAYCYSMSSNYNRVLKPEIILVKDGKSAIIVNRQTLENIIESDVIPEILE